MDLSLSPATRSTRGPLAWSIALSLALHLYALVTVTARLAAAPPGAAATPAVLQAYLVPAPASSLANPPEVLKNTLVLPHPEVLKEEIKPKRRTRPTASPAPRSEPAASPPKPPATTPRELAAARRETRGLDLRLPPPERGTGLRESAIERAERLPPEVLRETLGRLSEEMLYPPEALQLGLEGEVVILVELGESGRILNASIASGSGHAVLDEAAVRAVRKIGSLGPSSANKAILLPVRFRIVRGDR
jgi:protein TonB